MDKTSIQVCDVLPVVCDLVGIDSSNPGSDEREMTVYIQSFMQDLGASVDLLPVTERRVNAIARLRGRGELPPIAFTGHMDVVPVSPAERAKWNTAPFDPTVIDGRLYGRGSADMKGGLGAAMCAMKHIADSGEVPPGDVVLIATVDEEDLMRGAKAIIASELIDDIDELVVCEPTDLSIVISGRGRAWADVILHGQSGHASIENNGNNAIMQAVALIEKFKAEQGRVSFTPHPKLGNFFWQTTMISGGIEPAIVPDRCSVIVDTRPVPGQTNKEIWDVFREILRELKAEYPGFSCSMEIIEEREPWETDISDPLVQALERCVKNHGLPVRYDSANYTTDGCYFSKRGMRTVVFGPGDISQAHTENEWVAIEQLAEAANVYYSMMMDESRR